MIKADIVLEVARVANVPKQKAQESVDMVFNAIRDALAEGQKVEFRGFGVFRVKERKRGVGPQPQDGRGGADSPREDHQVQTFQPLFRIGTRNGFGNSPNS